MCVGERESRSKAKSEDWIGKVLSEIRLVLLVLLLLLVFDNRHKKRVRKRYYIIMVMVMGVKERVRE